MAPGLRGNQCRIGPPGAQRVALRRPPFLALRSALAGTSATQNYCSALSSCPLIGLTAGLSSAERASIPIAPPAAQLNQGFFDVVSLRSRPRRNLKNRG